MLQAHDTVLSNFALILIEIRARECALAIDDEAKRRLQAGLIGYLEFVCGAPQNHSDPILRIEDQFANVLRAHRTLSRAECRGATGQEHPSHPNTDKLRGEILAMTSLAGTIRTLFAKIGTTLTNNT